MSLQLTKRARTLLDQTNVKGQIIVEIDGFESSAIFGVIDVEKFARIGEDELTIGEFFIGGTIKDVFSKPVLALTGTSTKVNQQIRPDRGGSSSIQKMSLRFIDKNGLMARIFSPGQVVPDLHGVKARIYVSFQNASHPEDSVLVLSGIIKRTFFGPGYVDIDVAHSEELKRQELYTKIDTELTGTINSSVVTITLLSTNGLLLPEDMLTTFILVDDEIIQYAGINGNDITGCTRGVRGTIAEGHSDDTRAESYYVLAEGTINMALKMLISGSTKYFASSIEIKNFIKATDTLSVSNAIISTHHNIQDRYGLTEGDKVTITGSPNGVNNIIDGIMTGFGVFDGGSFIVVGAASMILEIDTPAIMKFESQYRTMTQERSGCDISPEHIDVTQFLFWDELFGSAFPTYEFELLDAINAKEFIDNQILHVAALYSCPRKGRISLHMSIPPLALEDVVTLDLSNVLNPHTLGIERSVNQFFYNAIQYLFDYDVIEDNFFKQDIRISQDSLDRIKVGIKPLKIEAKGLRTSIDGTNVVIDMLSVRLLDRYRFGAQRIKNVEVNYKTGLALEITDPVIVDGLSLRLVDTSRGDRLFEPKLFEVINRKWDYANGRVFLDLLQTGFEINARVGVMGPSSFIGVGSTTTEIRIVRSFTTKEFDLEIDKWLPYVGQKIKIRSDDYSFVEEVTLKSILTNRKDALKISPALSSIPPEGYIVDMPDYSGDVLSKAVWKNLHCFVCPVVDVVAGISGTVFTVSVDDAAKLFIGGFVRVHDPDFSVRNSDRIEISNLVGTTVTLKKDLGFTPVPGDEVRPVGFVDDSGLPYNYL